MPNDKEALRALEQTCELLEQSEPTPYSPLTPVELRRKLMKIVEALRNDQPYNRGILTIEFAPTSTVQEIAMENGWHDEYLEIASVVDKLGR